MHLDHDALQHMRGAGLDCIPSTLVLLLLLLRAGGTSQAREEEDRRHGAVVTGIAVVRGGLAYGRATDRGYHRSVSL